MYFRKDEEDSFTLELTPLIDVVFLLLIFFMVSTVFVDFTRRMDITLPTSKSAIPDETPKMLEIEMTVDKQIFLNGKKVDHRALEAAVQKSRSNEKRTAIIKADKSLPYGEVIKVMGILQAAEVQDISVAVK